MTPWLDDGDVRLYHGDAVDTLRRLPAGIAQTCITSPPYWGLRDYGTGEWSGGNEACDHQRNKPSDAEMRAKGHERGYAPGSNFSNYAEGYASSLYFSAECGRCGARRVDSQLGLEASPDLYVERMVGVFREVWRVLRDDGTLWLNLGDSYAHSAENRNGAPGSGLRSNRAADLTEKDVKRRMPPGLKPKDLVGIPWRVAFALQQPWYSGKIRNVQDRIWLAAMIDAEGCMFIHKRKAGTDSGAKFTRKDGTEARYMRTQDIYGSGLEVSSTDRVIVERCMEIVGIGSICEQSPQQNDRRKQTLYRWNLRTNECRDVIRELYPHLIAKQHEARLLISCPPSGLDAERAHEGLKSLHQGGTPDIDFAPPASMFERGWCLRSDVIWAKCIPNPMPESVTDRPTKAHEYLFLLTKQPRYFYDADAIREPHSPSTLDRAHLTKLASPKVRQEIAAGVRNGHPAEGGYADNPAGRNRRSVWTIPTEPFPEAHFATYPQALVRPCILAGTSDRGECVECGAPWVREVEVERIVRSAGGPSPAHTEVKGYSSSSAMVTNALPVSRTTGWRASCSCDSSNVGLDRGRGRVPTSGLSDRTGATSSPAIPQTVLDPFIGSGTTALVARNHGRRCIGVDLSEEYLGIASRRLQQLSLLADPA